MVGTGPGSKVESESGLFSCNAIFDRASPTLMEEVEASRQSRPRAWEVLQKIRATLSNLAGIAVPHPLRKTFDAEGKLLNDTLRRALQERNAALGNLCRAVKKFEPYLQYADLRGSEYAHALQDLKKALGHAEDLLQP